VKYECEGNLLVNPCSPCLYPTAAFEGMVLVLL